MDATQGSNENLSVREGRRATFLLVKKDLFYFFCRPDFFFFRIPNEEVGYPVRLESVD